MEENQNKEINEVIDAQPIIKEILVANTDAIKRMYKEIKNIYKNKNLDNESKETPEEIILLMTSLQKYKYPNVVLPFKLL